MDISRKELLHLIKKNHLVKKKKKKVDEKEKSEIYKIKEKELCGVSSCEEVQCQLNSARSQKTKKLKLTSSSEKLFKNFLSKAAEISKYKNKKQQCEVLDSNFFNRVDPVLNIEKKNLTILPSGNTDFQPIDPWLDTSPRDDQTILEMEQPDQFRPQSNYFKSSSSQRCLQHSDYLDFYSSQCSYSPHFQPKKNQNNFFPNHFPCQNFQPQPPPRHSTFKNINLSPGPHPIPTNQQNFSRFNENLPQNNLSLEPNQIMNETFQLNSNPDTSSSILYSHVAPQEDSFGHVTQDPQIKNNFCSSAENQQNKNDLSFFQSPPQSNAKLDSCKSLLTVLNLFKIFYDFQNKGKSEKKNNIEKIESYE